MSKPIGLSIIDYYFYRANPLSKGHYYFKIELQYDKYKADKIMDVRYSQIIKLYKILELKCPGCRIPKLKTKSFLQNISISKEEKEQIKSDTQKFLSHLIHHPILSDNSSVLTFFANSNIEKNLSSNKINKIKKEDDDKDDLNEDILPVNKSDDIAINKKDDLLSEFEVIEKNDIKNILDENDENELLNMFNNEKNDSTFKNLLNLVNSGYNYIKSFSKKLSNEIEDDKIPEIGQERNLSLSRNIHEKDFEFIKNISSQLGENSEINKYKDKLMIIKTSVDYLIKNFQAESSFITQKVNSLKNIIKYFKEVEKIEESKDENKKDGDNEENKKERLNRLDIKLVKGNINKIEKYASGNESIVYLQINPKIKEMIEYNSMVDDLLNIYNRKKKHILFLVLLKSQLNENEIKNKQTDKIENENGETEKGKNKKGKTEKEDENNNNLLKDIKFLQNKIDIDIKFINKLNKNLEYEINEFKKKKNKIYALINELYKNNYEKQSAIFEIINKDISFDSDSENSSKIKVENDENESNSEKSLKVEKKDENKKEENKKKENSFIDDFEEI